MRTVEEIRKDIDAADDAIVAALNHRFALGAEMRELKQRDNLPRVDAEREREIFTRVLSLTPAAERDTMYSIYERILGGSRGMIETIARGVAIKNGKVLLCKAKSGTSTYLPGGHIEFGETGREALEREVMEELGAASKAGEFLGVIENSFLQHGKKHAEINLVYRLELDGDCADPKAIEDWIEFEWIPISELNGANLLPSSMRQFC